MSSSRVIPRARVPSPVASTAGLSGFGLCDNGGYLIEVLIIHESYYLGIYIGGPLCS